MAQITTKDIKDIVRTELKDFVENKIETHVRKSLKSNVIESNIKEIVTNVLIKFYKTMYNRSSFWAGDLKK